jgi:hypothetical protein
VTIKKQKNRQSARQTIVLPATASDGFKVGKVVAKFLEATKHIPDGIGLIQSSEPNGSWTGRQFLLSAWNKALRTALSATGVPQDQLASLSSHSLRKGGFSTMVKAGVPLSCVQTIIGHKSAESARPYMKWNLADQEKAARKI